MELNPKIVTYEPTSMYDALKAYDGEDCFISPNDYVIGYKFPHGNVTDFIPVDRVEELTHNTPCMIISQTGTRKTTFIFEGILLTAKKKGKKILMLESRTALMDQCRLIAAKYECPDYLTDFTPEGLRKKEHFRDVDIMSYQSLFYKLENNTLENFDEYGYVILDEAHYFTQDAAFSPYTRKLHELIVKKFSKCVRIYLTATPEGSLDSIISMEYKHRSLPVRAINQYGTGNIKNHFLVYYFDMDYHYLKPFFFKEEKEIIERIMSDSSDDKFLICVDSKVQGLRYLANLGDDLAEYIDADLKNTIKANFVDTLVRSESFEKKVLITTSVLDVGVNINDSRLRNVIIHSNDIVHFRQAIGRKRKGKNEAVKLFIHIPNYTQLIRKRGYLISNLTEAEKILNDIQKGSTAYLDTLNCPFYTDRHLKDWRIGYNGYTLEHWSFRIKELSKMIDAATRHNNPDEAIARTYLSWLGLEALYNPGLWLGFTHEVSNDFKELTAFLDTYLGRNLVSSEYDSFRRELEPIHNANVPSAKRWRIRKDSITSVAKIRAFFEEFVLPYELTQISTKPLIYRLERR